MKAVVATLALLSACTVPLAPNALSAVGADPPPGAALPRDVSLIDEHGAGHRLADYQGFGPILLIFVDYRCTYLCGVGAPLLTAALDDRGHGDDPYRLIAIGIDPRATTADMRRFRAHHLGASPSAREMALLQGDAAATQTTTRVMGYRYLYDGANGVFAHNASIYVLTPDGRVSAVLDQFKPLNGSLSRALDQARAASPPTLIQNWAHLCYGFAAAHGLYTHPILMTLQFAGVAFLAFALIVIARLALQRRAP